MRAITALTYVLPHRLLSSMARSLAYSTHPGVKQTLIDTVVKKFGVDMGEAAEPDTQRDETFKAFFTRALKPGARTPDADPRALLRPADGRISECGRIGFTGEAEHEEPEAEPPPAPPVSPPPLPPASPEAQATDDEDESGPFERG
jgi:phosphatidylserine decarboxylase